MAIFRELSSQDISTDRDSLDMLVDVLSNDISSSSTRKKYQVFVTGGVGPGITSSLFQTVFDQDFTLQTANPIFDMTFGLSPNSSLVGTGSFVSIDANTNKYYFTSQSVMMREKMDIYRIHAKNLLGDANSDFTLVSGSTTANLREALFIDFKRLFARDRLKRETFAIRLYQTASTGNTGTGEKIYTDVGSNSNIEQSYGGQVSTVVDSANTTYPVGLLYLDQGIAVLDTQRVFDTTSPFTMTIRAMEAVSGTMTFSGSLNKFLVSASMDDILDHVCLSRFSGSTATAIAFQNQTFLNSTYFTCRFAADEFNYSSNPTYTDSNGKIIVIDPGQEDVQRSFSFITSIGLYDAYDNLLAVGKASRPIFKNSQRDLSIRLRIDA